MRKRKKKKSKKNTSGPLGERQDARRRQRLTSKVVRRLKSKRRLLDSRQAMCCGVHKGKGGKVPGTREKKLPAFIHKEGLAGEERGTVLDDYRPNG